MPVEPQVTIQSHVHCSLRALRLSKSITQFEEPVSLPHLKTIVSFHQAGAMHRLAEVGGMALHSLSCSLLHLWGGGEKNPWR